MDYAIPALADVYAALAPWAEALLRATVGLLLVPHALRMAFGLFPDTGLPVRSVRDLSQGLDAMGWRPGRVWAPLIVATELIGGPLLALGLFTRPAALAIAVFLAMSIVQHRRAWFWNQQGAEYPVLWTVAALYFVVAGGGEISLDHAIGWAF